MTKLESIMVDVYYTLIKNGKRDSVPDEVSESIKIAVNEKLENDH